ncbi:hypothetical protein ACFC09_15650 [Streptomyces sp. NPDC056161]|uniref:hypothetical protein n=1 Tax=Streptomyces sp. NPDC056161 TaxID=3345732 RepID=UPI0035D55476
MAQFGCGGSRCTCQVTAGPGVTVIGNGSPGAPYVIGVGPGAVTCDQVRPCISAGGGASYDPATGVIGVDLSETPGNTLVLGPDGLYVPPATVGCGLTGNGSVSSPVQANTGSWPYPCDVDAAAAGVYCDSGGQLRGEPIPKARFQQSTLGKAYPGAPLVPTTAEEVVEELQLPIVNPDKCRAAVTILFQEVDVDLNLPRGGAGGAGIDGDDMMHLANEGSATITREHVQVGKLTNLVLSPGETLTRTMQITMGRGAGGATYTRIQATLRAWVFSLPVA